MTAEGKTTWLASFSHFITHGFMTLFPAVMVVIAGENSMSFFAIGVIANIGYFLYGVGAFPAGWLADKFGSKRVLTVGVIGMSAASMLVAASTGPLSFGVAYALLGAFASIHHPAGLSLIARRVTTNKGKALGLHGVLGNVGLFLTPLFAASCVLLFDSWRAAYLIYGLFGVCFSVMLYRARIPEEADLSLRGIMTCCGAAGRGRRPEEKGAVAGGAERGKTSYLPAALLLLFAGSVLSGYVFRGSLTFFPALMKQEVRFIANHDEPVVMAGYLTTAVLSLGLVGAWFGGWINDKVSRPEFVPAVIFLCIAPLLYLISRYSDEKLIAVSCLFSLIYYAWQPAQNYLIAKYTKKASHGIGFGFNFFLIFGLGSIATASGGYVSDDFGVDVFYRLMAWVAAAAAVTGFAVYLARRYRLRYCLALERED